MITFLNIQDKLTKSILYCDTPVYSRKGRYRKLCTEVTFLLGNTQAMTIKPGFTWDENSIPWILQPFFPKSGMYAASALVHDALYYLTIHERKWVEEEFRRWMIATGVSKRQVFFRYWAVKLFGWRWWNRNKKRPSDRCINNRKYIMLH
jgi:hypothetical protein